MANNHKVFISHAWDHSDDLENLRRLLNERGYFNVEFKEVTKDEPINSSNSYYIKNRLREKIQSSDILIGLCGIYASHSEWMKWELEIANIHGIPIVGVIPRGQIYISRTVDSYSIENVNWNTESIVNAIRRNSK